jgi:dienelactone hydrolase
VREIAAILCLALLTLAGRLPGQTAQLSDADLTARAERFVDLMARKDFEGAARDFDDTMKGAAPPAKLAEIWTALEGQLGKFQERTSVRMETAGGYRAAFVTSRFERTSVDLQVTFDNAGRIAGFFVKPAAPSPAAPSAEVPPAYVKKDAFKEGDVKVGSGEWALPGTLALPVGPGPFPAVVLVHGSGPNDRDETIGPNKPFRDLAWGLASRGIAVLRYDKRTLVHRDKLTHLTNVTVKEETVDDALAAVELLRHTGGIDPHRIFVLGHSLGGMLIPRIGSRDAGLAGLIVLAGSARPLEDAIVEQVTYLASLDDTVSEDEKKNIEDLRRQAAQIKALKPGSTEPVLDVPASYWLDLRGYDPPEAARKLRQPMLILQGERDYQVTMDEFRRWQKALGDRKDVVFKSYPALNHLFIAGEGRPDPTEYQKAGHVDPAVIEDIATWIAKPVR